MVSDKSNVAAVWHAFGGRCNVVEFYRDQTAAAESMPPSSQSSF